MKKILILLGVIGLTASPLVSVVSCGKKTSKQDTSKLAPISSLILKSKNIVSNYIQKNVVQNLNTVLEGDAGDPNENINEFFTKNKIDKIYSENNPEQTKGEIPVDLNIDELKAFKNDIWKIFNATAIKAELNTMKTSDSYSAYFTGVSDILKSIHLKDEKSNKVLINSVSNKKSISSREAEKIAIRQVKFNLAFELNYKDVTNGGETISFSIDAGTFTYTIYSNNDYKTNIELFEKTLAIDLSKDHSSPVFMTRNKIFKKPTIKDGILNSNDKINNKIEEYENIADSILEYTKKSETFANEQKSETFLKILKDWIKNNILSKYNIKGKVGDISVSDMSQSYTYTAFDGENETIYENDDFYKYLLENRNKEKINLEEFALQYAQENNDDENHDIFVEDEFLDKFINNSILQGQLDNQEKVIEEVSVRKSNLGSYGMLGFESFNLQLDDFEEQISVNVSIPYYFSLDDNAGTTAPISDFQVVKIGRFLQELNGLGIDFKDENSIMALDGTYGDNAVETPYEIMDKDNWSWWSNSLWNLENDQGNNNMYTINEYSWNNPESNKAMTLAPVSWGWVKQDKPVVVQLGPGSGLEHSGEWEMFGNWFERPKTLGGLLRDDYTTTDDKVLNNDGFLANFFSYDYFNIAIKFNIDDDMYNKVKETINSGLSLYYIRNSSTD